jgi:uroporphyrinogen-III synthase
VTPHARPRRPPAASLQGRRVLTLESRRSPELALLVVNYGGTPIIAPSVREVALESNRQALAFAGEVIDGRFDLVIWMTGVGVRLLLKSLDAGRGADVVDTPRRDAFVEALARTRMLARGPKPVAALREVGLTPWATVPTPNTWRELVTELDAHAGEMPLEGARVAVQEYGLPNPDLERALISRGASVVTVPIYRWALPDDVAPLQRAVWTIVRNEVEVIVLTASIQLVHLLCVAREMRLERAMREGLARVVVASIGPMTSDELRHAGLPIDFEPSVPKMGFLVKELADQCAALVERKRSGLTRCVTTDRCADAATRG